MCLFFLGVQAARSALTHGAVRVLAPTRCVRLAAHFLHASLPLAFPALLFTVQSQLNLFAATGLDAVSFSGARTAERGATQKVSRRVTVTNQLKILPTAFFSALYLGRRLSQPQWASLPGLALGVAIVNASTGQLDNHGAVRFGREWVLGLAAAIAAAVLSGYAGVYCERLLKFGFGGSVTAAPAAAPPGEGLRASAGPTAGSARLWDTPGSPYAAPGRVTPFGRRPDGAAVPLLTLNLQLSLWGALLAGVQVLGASSTAEAGAAARQPLAGFGGYAWSVVGLQALGGLVVSVVIKHTDNIIKGFAMAISILLSWGLSIPIFGLRPSPIFMLGLLLVVASVVLFSIGGADDAQAFSSAARALAIRAGHLSRAKGSWAHVTSLFAGVITGMLCALAWKVGIQK